MNIEKYCAYCRINHGQLHADFTYTGVTHNTSDIKFVVIRDLDKGNRSVTNDVDYVLWRVNREIPNMVDRYIIYKDSQGVYDELIIDKAGKFKGYRSLNERDPEKAMLRCLALHEQDKDLLK